MNILNEIADHKRIEIEERKQLYPMALLERSKFFESGTVSLVKYLLREDKSGIIAEFKKSSPSKGIINAHARIEDTSIGYMQAGAAALSVLTDTQFFGGSLNDLTIARELNYCPILRKDFIIDEYQVIEAKSIGADAILLIAAILTPNRIKQLAALAHSLNMESILEVHSCHEMEFYQPDIPIIGINNRNLEDFTTDIKTSLQLSDLIPDEAIAISESGLDDPADLVLLKKVGFSGFLIGEHFMKTGDPANACQDFISRYIKMLKWKESL